MVTELRNILSSGKILGQIRPSTLNPTEIYSPPAGFAAVVTHIIICNTSSSNVKARLFIDNDGTTYNESTAIYYGKTTPANDSLIFNLNIPINSNGSLAGRTAAINDLTFTAIGIEEGL